MKDSLEKIINRITNLISFKKINPHNHWNNLLYIFFTITITLIIFSLYLLSEIRNQKTLELTPEFKAKSSLINEKLFGKITESFNKKVLKQKEVIDGGRVYKDPSN